MQALRIEKLVKSLLRGILATFRKKIHKMLSFKNFKLFEEHVYVFFCQMPKIKARSGPFQKGADVQSNRRQGHVTLHHFETAHYCECIGHYKKRHTYAPFMNLKMGIMSK